MGGAESIFEGNGIGVDRSTNREEGVAKREKYTLSSNRRLALDTTGSVLVGAIGSKKGREKFLTRKKGTHDAGATAVARKKRQGEQRRCKRIDREAGGNRSGRVLADRKKVGSRFKGR